MRPFPKLHLIHQCHSLIPYRVVDQFTRTWFNRCSKVESWSSAHKAIELAPDIDDVQQTLSVDVEFPVRRRDLSRQRIGRCCILGCRNGCGDVQRACDRPDRQRFESGIGQATIGSIHCGDELGDQPVLSRIGNGGLGDRDSGRTERLDIVRNGGEDVWPICIEGQSFGRERIGKNCGIDS